MGQRILQPCDSVILMMVDEYPLSVKSGQLRVPQPTHSKFSGFPLSPLLTPSDRRPVRVGR